MTEVEELGAKLMDTLDTIQDLVAKVDAEAGPGSDVHRVADEAVARLRRSQLNVMASMWLAEEVKAVRRARTQQVERAAEVERPSTRVSRLTPEGEQHFKTLAAQEEQRARESDARFHATIQRAMNTLAAQWKMEWTDELLASGFSLPDGEVVTWGEATIEQHEQRAAMFEMNAEANAKGAVRHRHAINVLHEAGATCLREVVAGD